MSTSKRLCVRYVNEHFFLHILGSSKCIFSTVSVLDHALNTAHSVNHNSHKFWSHFCLQVIRLFKTVICIFYDTFVFSNALELTNQLT